MEDLKAQKCEACQAGAPPASQDELAAFQTQHPEWKVNRETAEPRVEREYSFPDFASALAFANRIGALAEAENHHPLITIEWGKVLVAWWTHKIKNIHRNDLIMAAKSDDLFSRQ